MTAERLCLPAVVVVLACSAPAVAEEVYDFGKGLVDKIGFVDLAKEYLDRAARDESLTAEERMEAVLGLAAVFKALSDRETDPREKERLRDEAMEYASDFLKKAGAAHPKRAAASGLMASIERDRARAKICLIKDETDAARKRHLLSEAHEACDEVVKQRAGARAAAWERFQGVEREYQEQDSHGGRFRHERDELARKAAEAMHLYCGDVLKLAELFDEDSDKRRLLLESLIKDLTDEVKSWDGDEFRGVQLSVRFFLGRACALSGDYERAARDGFDHILKEDHSLYRDQGYTWVRALKLHAFYFKAKAALDAERYDEAARTVDAMLGPPQGFPSARVEDIGKAALLLKSEAYAGQKKHVEAIETLVSMASGKDGWAARAREAIRRFVDLAREDRRTQLPPWALFHSGRGHYWLALEAGEKGDAEEAEREFELAIDHLMEAINACRRPGTSFLTRCRYEPRCWSRMALAYHHLGLHYESALCFDAVVKYFSPDVVGKELRGTGQHEARAERIRDRLTEENGEEPADEMVHSELFDELSTRKGYGALRDLKWDVRKAANAYRVALRAHKRESRSEFDAHLYAAAIGADRSADRRADFQMAQGLEEEATRACADGRLEEARGAFLRAAGEYVTVERHARSYQAALFRAAACYYRVMSIDAEEHEEEAAEYGRKTLNQLRVYLDHVNSTPTTDEKLLKLREEYRTEARYYEASVHFKLGEYAESVKGYENFLQAEKRSEKHVPLAKWNQFESCHQLAVQALGGGDFDGYDKWVREAEERATAMADDATMGKYFATASSYLVAAYDEAVNAAGACLLTPRNGERASQRRYATYRAGLVRWRDRMERHSPRPQLGQ